MPIFKSKDFSIFFEEFGSGKPLVLVSGFASGAWLWFSQIEELAKHFRVIVFDPRGISRSELSPGISSSIVDIADDIAQILSELQIESASVIGTSFGGFVAQEFALKYPEKLDRLVLACTSFGGKDHILPKNVEALSAFASIADINNPERIRKFMVPAFTKQFSENNFEVIEKTCMLREQNLVPEAVYLQQLTEATKFDTNSRIPHIKAKTLVISGDTDLIVPVENSRNLADLLPDSRLEIVENGGHLFFIEQASKFNQIVIDFLK